jgi:hypothetical protein
MSHRCAELAAQLIRTVEPFVPSVERRPHDHIGAILADSILQPGLNHSSVVAPRVGRILREYPEAATIQGLDRTHVNTAVFLDWTHAEKIARFDSLVARLRAHGINSTNDLHRWLELPGSTQALIELRGIGPKTVDYLRMMTGYASVPVDRHLRRFLAVAGIHETGYAKLRESFVGGCALAGVDAAAFEFGLWLSLAGSRRSRRAVSR